MAGGLMAGSVPVAVPPSRRLQQHDQTPVLGTTFNVPLIQQNTDTVSSCTLNVECAPQWANESSGVVTIYSINLVLQAVGLCTGTCPTFVFGRAKSSKGMLLLGNNF